MLTGVFDTIAAISTAPGRSGLALIRVSGPDVATVAASVGLPDLEPRRATYRHLTHPEDGRPLDRVVATRFVEPASFTGEDVLEIGCHGGALVPALVLDALCAAGARVAEPGEFARRAFLHGKLDLVQVEATLDLIDARSEAHHRAALFQLDGALSRRVDRLREELLKLQAMLSYEIDFPEEDDGPIPRKRIEAAAGRLGRSIDELLVSAPEGELLRDGALTVIAGRPNVGKSSMFNALLGRQRAIVTEIPGTTRDAIEALISVQGYPFRLVDTAGMRTEAGILEEMGIEVAHRYVDEAPLLLLCVEEGRSLSEEEESMVRAAADRQQRLILVRTKADLSSPLRSGEVGPTGSPSSQPLESGALDVLEVVVSTVTGSGLGDLQAAMLGAVFAGLRDSGEPPLVTSGRQIRALRHARTETEAFSRAMEEGLPPEVACAHLQEATLALEELLGVVEVEDVLDVLFSSFCVGK
jgi:tRNA modification GTPase